LEGWQIGLAAVVMFFVLRAGWKAYTHPAHTLGRQAANMNWVSDGREDDGKFKNVRYLRGDLIAVVPFKKPSVILRQNGTEHEFKDFIEVERWLAKVNASNDIDKVASEPLNENSHENAAEDEYIEKIEGHRRLVKHYENVMSRCEMSPPFCDELYRLYSAGFKTDTNYKFIALTAAQAASDWSTDPKYAQEFMRAFGNNLFNKKDGPKSDDQISEYHQEIYSFLRDWDSYSDFFSISNKDKDFEALSIEAIHTGLGRGIPAQKLVGLLVTQHQITNLNPFWEK
jgi:hypothetical protein